MRVHLTLVSRNAKTGPIPVSTTSADSCPPSCAFYDRLCYAKGGPLAIHWRKVTQGLAGDSYGVFLDRIAALPKGQLFRHNQAGDLMGQGDSLDIQALALLVQASKGKRGFTYTHKPLSTQAERDAIRDANKGGFTVNLSGNNLTHADTLADMDIAPVTTVLPHDVTDNLTTPKGRKVVVCPATQRDNVSCATCKLCAIATRDCIVGFPAHGASKRKTSEVASA